LGLSLTQKEVGKKKIKLEKTFLIYGIVKRLLPFNPKPQCGIFSNSKSFLILVMGIFHYQRSHGPSSWSYFG
jgi:hypothetical protein